jgi:hypothetical protein
LPGLGTRGPARGAELPFELLVAVLELLDRPGQLPDLCFKPFDPQNLVGERFVLAGGLLTSPLLSWPLLSWALLALRHRRRRPLAKHAFQDGQRRAVAVLRDSRRRDAKCGCERRCI